WRRAETPDTSMHCLNRAGVSCPVSFFSSIERFQQKRQRFCGSEARQDIKSEQVRRVHLHLTCSRVLPAEPAISRACRIGGRRAGFAIPVRGAQADREAKVPAKARISRIRMQS